MTNFILFDNHIIVGHNDIVLDIIDIRTNNSIKSIGSKKNKYKLMSNFIKSNKLIFNDWNELCEYYNIINLNKSGTYINYCQNNQIRLKFYHMNFRIEGLYEEFYENGNLKISCNYISNKLYGPYKEYNIYGSLLVSANYHNDLLNGEYEENKGDYKINAMYKDGKLDRIYHKIKKNSYSYEYYSYSNGKKNGEFIIKYLDTWNKNIFTNTYHTKYYVSGEYCDDILKFVNIYIIIYSEFVLQQKIYFDKYIFYTIENLCNNVIHKYVIEDKIFDYINNFKRIKTDL
jgi:hypothetical protein